MNTWHIATARRVYNGAPCSDMQKELDSVAALQSKAVRFNAYTIYFPMENKWSVWIGNKQVSKFHTEEGDALVEFLDSVDNAKNVKTP